MQLLLKEFPAGGRSLAVCYFELCIRLFTPYPKHFPITGKVAKNLGQERRVLRKIPRSDS